MTKVKTVFTFVIRVTLYNKIDSTPLDQEAMRRGRHVPPTRHVISYVDSAKSNSGNSTTSSGNGLVCPSVQVVLLSKVNAVWLISSAATRPAYTLPLMTDGR